jgi:hypothetical protein
MFGGDLESAASVLRSVSNRLQYQLQQRADMYNRREHVAQIYANVLRAASHILSPAMRVVWGDLRSDAERAKVIRLRTLLRLFGNTFETLIWRSI